MPRSRGNVGMHKQININKVRQQMPTITNKRHEFALVQEMDKVNERMPIKKGKKGTAKKKKKKASTKLMGAAAAHATGSEDEY